MAVEVMEGAGDVEVEVTEVEAAIQDITLDSLEEASIHQAGLM